MNGTPQGHRILWQTGKMSHSTGKFNVLEKNITARKQLQVMFLQVSVNSVGREKGQGEVGIPVSGPRSLPGRGRGGVPQHPAGSSTNSAFFMNFSKFHLDVFQCPNAKSMGISYFKSYRINQ